MMNQQIKFLSSDNLNFYPTLQSRVNDYFKRNNISKDGGTGILLKSLLLLFIFVIPYLGIVVFQPPIIIAFFLLVIMGFGKAGVGMSIMHDALHGAFSKKKWVNNLFGASLYLLGGNPINWKIQHNVLHHTYPNVYKVDEDVSTKGFVVRLSPESDLKPVHRYQWLYVLPLYGLMTLSFMIKDFRQLNRYNKSGETAKQGLKPTTEMLRLVITKLLYLTSVLAIPLLLTDYNVTQIIIGFLIVHFTAGLILSVIFQLAHVVEGVDYPERDETGDLKTTWAIHQLATTSNFAPKSRLLHWFSGGLNFQVEHHLFPHVSHIHYPKIAPIVKKTAEEFGINYNSEKSLISALQSHLNMLKTLGRKEAFDLA
jgi:linoleoyl-CoA desaturase